MGNTKELPRNVANLVFMNAPNRQTSRCDLNDATHSFGFGVQSLVPQQCMDMLCRIVVCDIEMNDTVPGMAQATIEKTSVESEKSWPVHRCRSGMISSSFIPIRPRSTPTCRIETRFLRS